ncbi:Aldo/keto reductase [Hypoxylon sp. NC1633]|nr:Aldo/keto reductase [Hypoxylon sp. NC1633]
MDSKSAPIPKLLYGTAWKKNATTDLVFLALKAGYRGIDTGAIHLFYKEALVGVAVLNAMEQKIVKRSDLFIQTKYSPMDEHGPHTLAHSLIHRPSASLEEQVHSSVRSSLTRFSHWRFEPTYFDSLLLHSPLHTLPDTIKVWKMLETYVPHKIRQLGICNTPLEILDYLCTSPDITVRPAYVQNSFYPGTRWEVDLRAYCREKGIMFQTFWTLTGNRELELSTAVRKLADSTNVEPPVALYALVLGLGGTAVLDGTSNVTHMGDNLNGIETIEGYAQSEEGKAVWSECLEEFKKLIGEKG